MKRMLAEAGHSQTRTGKRTASSLELVCGTAKRRCQDHPKTMANKDSTLQKTASYETIAELGLVVQNMYQNLQHRAVKKDKDRSAFINCDMAYEYSSLQHDWPSMTDDVKIMIGVTLKKLQKLNLTSGGERGAWDDVMSCMMNLPVVLPRGDAEEHQFKKLESVSFDGENMPQTQGGSIGQNRNVGEVPTHTGSSAGSGYSLSPTSAVKIKEFVNTIIMDKEAGAFLKLDDQFYAAIARMIATNTEWKVKAADFREWPVMKLGVLQFPDATHKHFKLYFVSLTAWTKIDHFVGNTGPGKQTCGLTGDFRCREFNPRKDFISSVSENTKIKAIEEVEKAFKLQKPDGDQLPVAPDA